jgi:hypothetical protein
MFYQESEINEHLTCPKCKNKFNDPRLIDCGGSLCKACIDLLIIDDENRFKCPVCEDLHEIPANGYLKNAILAKLCDLKANEMSKSAQANALKTQLGILKQNSDAFLKLIDKKASEHCTDLRREVDLSTDKLIESINAYETELLAQNDEYENNLISKNEISDDYRMRLKKLIKETNELHSNSMDYLRQFELKDEDLLKASANLSRCQENLNHERGIFMNHIFGGHLLKFVENATQNNAKLIGTLEDDKSRQVYQEKINKLNIYDLEDKLNYYHCESPCHYHKISVQILEKENFCVAYCFYEDFFVSMFNFGLNLLKTECFGEFIYDEYKMTKLKDSLILCLIDQDQCENRYDDDKPEKSTIRKLDYEFDELDEIVVYHEIKAVEGFESHLYCLSSIHKANEQVYVYDENLTQIKRIGQQEDLRKPFYIADSFKKIRVCELYLVFLDGKQVVMVNRQNGLVEKSFNFDSFDLILKFDSFDFVFNGKKSPHAFKYDRENCNLIKYDLEGNSQLFSLENTCLDAVTKKKMKLIDCVDGRFIFFTECYLSLIF